MDKKEVLQEAQKHLTQASDTITRIINGMTLEEDITGARRINHKETILYIITELHETIAALREASDYE